MNKYSEKLYRLYCEICNFNLITDGKNTDKLVEIKTSPIPGGIPKRDKLTGKMVYSKSIKQPKKFRCPQCGRGIIPKLLTPNRPTHTEETEKDVVETQEEVLNKIIERLEEVYESDSTEKEDNSN